MTKSTLLRSAAIVLAFLFLLSAVAGCKPKENTDVTDVEVIDESPLPSSLPSTTSDPEASALPSGIIDPTPAPSSTPEPSATVPPPSPDGVPDPNETPMPEGISYEKDYDKYKKLNSDVIGWLKVPNTRINYPVLQTKDNDYYIHRNAEKKSSKSGAVFMDFRNAREEEQRHIIIYGHNMRNGTMFHDLNSYKLKEFYDQNRTITLWWDGKETKWEVYAAFIVTTDIYFIHTKFGSGENFLDYMNTLKKMSKFSSDVKLKKTDQVLTLTTCTYEYDNARFVVQARRITE